MAWKKVVVSGSSPEFDQLTLDTPLASTSGGTGLSSITTIGSNLLQLPDQSGITFLRMNANETVSALSAADFRTAIGAGDGSGTVTSVAITGTDGIDVDSGSPITTAGTITLGLSNIANSALANSTISGVSLGSDLNDLTVDNSSIELNTGTTFNGSAARTISVKDGGISNAMLAGSIANSKLSNSTISGVALGNNLNDLTVDDSTIALNSGTTFNGSAGVTVSVKAGGIGTTQIADSLGEAGVNQFTGSFSGSFTGDVVADLADLVAGDGLTGDNYDGQTTRTFAVNVDDSSIEIDTDALRVKESGITNAMLAGSIANSKLVSSTISGKALGTNLDSLSVDDSSIEYSAGSAYNGSAASTIRIKASGVTNDMLNGSIANGKLANSTISGVSLGSNLNSLSVDDSSIEYSVGTSFNGSAASTIRVKESGITNAMLNGDIANGKLANSSITVGGTAFSLGDTVTGASIATALNSDLGGNFTIGNQSSDSAIFTGDIQANADVTVAGDLTVQGTASFQSTDNLLVKDKFIMLASGSAGATDGGIVIEQANAAGGPTGAVFAYDGLSTGRWGISTGFNPTGSGYTPDAFMAAAVLVSGTDPDTVAAAYKVAGNIACTNDGEIYIYRQ